MLRLPCRIVALVFFLLALAVPVAPTAQSPPPSGEVTFTKDIAPILQRSCQNCHRPEGVAPMSLITYEEVATLGPRHQDEDRTRVHARGDAAVVRREEHRHPEIQERPVAERRGDREDREVGGQRRTTRQSGRHAAAARVRQHRRVDDRGTGSGAAIAGRHRSGGRARPVGRFRARADGSHRGSLRVGGRGQRGQRHSQERRDQHGRRTLRVSPHDVFQRGRGRAWGRDHRGRLHQLADSRGRAQRGYLSARGRQAPGGEFGPLAQRRPSPLERPGDQGASRIRLQVLPEGLQAALSPLEPASGQRHRHRREAESSRIRSSTRTPCCRSTRRSSRSSRTCTRRACACAWRRSGATTSRRSTASATTTTG